jgi:hypothetical protein
MFGKKTIDDHFKDFDTQFNTTKRTLKAGLIGIGIGFAAGVAGGIILGESINDYVEALKQAPAIIQYAVDAASAVVVGGFGAGVGGTIAQIPGLYKIFRRF